MAHRLERHDRHFVRDDCRNDSAARYGKLSAVSAKSDWRRARIRGDRRLDLLAREGEAEVWITPSPVRGLIEVRQLSAIANLEPVSRSFSEGGSQMANGNDPVPNTHPPNVSLFRQRPVPFHSNEEHERHQKFIRLIERCGLLNSALRSFGEGSRAGTYFISSPGLCR